MTAELEPRAYELLAPALFTLVGAARRALSRVAATAQSGALDPEAIHDFRVALRRLRTALRPARRVFGKRELKEIGLSLKRFADATGALRDEEVLRETLVGLALPARAKGELEGWLTQRARQERARRRAAAAILLAPDSPDSPSPTTVLARLERRIGRRRREERGVVQLAMEATSGAFAEVREVADAGPRSAAAMHALRIRFKRLRYTAELFAPVLGEPSATITRSASRMQTRLGELHDIEDALVRVARARGLTPTAAASVRRALLRRRRAAFASVRRDLGEELAHIAGELDPR